MKSHGIILSITKLDSAPFWASLGSRTSWGNDGDNSVVEVTYVDDEAAMLAAPSPKQLSLAINLLLDELVSIFAAFGFHINWSAGKTEAFVRFRGKGAADATRKLHGECQSKLPLPKGAGADHHIVVHQYKHLGSIISADGAAAADVPRRVQIAMAAFAPLALKIFGAAGITRRLRLTLAGPLVVSRLLYNTETWTFGQLRCTLSSRQCTCVFCAE